MLLFGTPLTRREMLNLRAKVRRFITTANYFTRKLINFAEKY